MDLSDLITREAIMPALKAKTKKQTLQELALRAAELTGLSAREILDSLVQREQLASTGLGRGIAIPHVIFPSVKRIFCLFARLAEPIEFEALDDQPVDLIFLLIAPEHASGDRLKAMARISRLMHDPNAIERLRATADRIALHAVLTEPATSHAA